MSFKASASAILNIDRSSSVTHYNCSLCSNFDFLLQLCFALDLGSLDSGFWIFLFYFAFVSRLFTMVACTTRASTCLHGMTSAAILIIHSGGRNCFCGIINVAANINTLFSTTCYECWMLLQYISSILRKAIKSQVGACCLSSVIYIDYTIELFM